MKPPDDHERTHLRVGEIARPHGVRGELKLRLDFEGSRALHDVEQIVVVSRRGEAARRAVESVRGSAKGLIVALEGVDTREDADALRGATVWVSRQSQPPLEPGEYYLVDLVGCDVVFAGQVMARVKQVRPDPSVDTMVIELEDGTIAEVPIVDAWVGEVDVEARRVELLSEDGIIR